MCLFFYKHLKVLGNSLIQIQILKYKYMFSIRNKTIEKKKKNSFKLRVITIVQFILSRILIN